MTIPKTTKAWTLTGDKGLECLTYGEQSIKELAANEVLVRIRAGSLNYRDLLIPKGQYPFAVDFPVVPGSDGAGEVLAVGSSVKRFATGDRVVTLFSQRHAGGVLDSISLASGLGGVVDGTFREYGAFSEEGLVRMPDGLSFVEASTLSCAGVTAWNALFGLKGVEPGQWVLTQGTGGVSLFALQFAKFCGAKVVATTGSKDKAHILEKLGADHIINYKVTPEWGGEARRLTPGGRGFDHVVEVAGPTSMKQSLECVTVDGEISIVGFVGGMGNGGEPGFLDCLSKICTVRGLLVGSRVQMEDMCRAVEAGGERLKPVVAEKVFKLSELKEAMEYLESQKHYGKVCVEI